MGLAVATPEPCTPSLAELAGDPARVAGLPPETARGLLLQAAPLLLALAAQASAPNGTAPATGGAEPDRLLTVGEAAAQLQASKDWLYRHAGRLPFTVRLGPRQLRFSAHGLGRYIRARQGRQVP
jgi:excisionase family DNA binding protein